MTAWDVVISEHEVTTVREAETLRIDGGHAQFYDRSLQLIAAFAPGHWQSIMKKIEVQPKRRSKMAKVLNTTISWTGSTSPDVVGYALYVQDAPDPADYSSPRFEVGNVTSVILSTLPGMTTKDGVFNIGIAAIDDAGNESDMAMVNDLPLDFAAPAAPGALVVTRT